MSNRAKSELLFSQYELESILFDRKQKMREAIGAMDSYYLLNNNLESLLEQLEYEYSIQPPQLQKDKISVKQSDAKIDISRDPMRHIIDRSKPFYIDGTRFTFFVPFTGAKGLFNSKPSSFTLNPPHAIIGQNELELIYETANPNPIQIRSQFDKDLSTIVQWLGYIENDVSQFNASIRSDALSRLESRRQRVLEVKDIVNDLGFQVRQDDTKVSENMPPKASPPIPQEVKKPKVIKARRAKANSAKKLSVFLCHSTDDKPAVRDLYKQLNDDGVMPWLDEEDLLPGQRWREVIPIAVRKSDIVIVCLTPASITKKGYVQKEIKYALDVADEQPEGTIFIIPLKLEECEMPERLRDLHYVNLFEERGYEKLMRSIRTRAAKLGIKIKSTIP